MVNVALLDDFYTFSESESDPFDVSEEVKDAYFIFIKDFCPMVSSTWKKYLSKYCENRDTASFVLQSTRSDEAYSYWLIRCLYTKVQGDAQFIKANGMKKWMNKRKKGKIGKHDSNDKFDECVKTFKKN